MLLLLKSLALHRFDLPPEQESSCMLDFGRKQGGLSRGQEHVHCESSPLMAVAASWPLFFTPQLDNFC
jgi:hypothetical protein